MKLYLISSLIFSSFVGQILNEVVTNEFAPCVDYFYKQTPPSGLDEVRDLKHICQQYDNQYHFGTLYNTEHRIPIYSAYTLELTTCSSGPQKRKSGDWFIEPQVSGLRNRSMNLAGRDSDVIKIKQAINGDYSHTNFDRGHLNPNFYQCGVGRTATFTLTNAVPQDPCFNQQMWKDMETRSKEVMETTCSFPGARRYFVTGAVPGNAGRKIPSRVNDLEVDRNRQYDRVSIPDSMWTAACCDASGASDEDRDKGFSFAYSGDNVPESLVEPSSVRQLEVRLQSAYNVETISIFVDSCNNLTDNAKQVMKTMSVPAEIKAAQAIIAMSGSSTSSVTPAKRRLIGTVNQLVNTDSVMAQKSWKLENIDFCFQEKRNNIVQTNHLLNTQYMLSPVLIRTSVPVYGNIGSTSILHDKPSTSILHDELRKRRATRDQNSISTDKYKLNMSPVPQNYHTGTREKRSTLALKSLVVDEYRVVHANGFTNDLTIQGDRCRQDHPCGAYGEQYKWCYTDWSNNWDYCCAQLCGFYTDDVHYPQCYTGNTTDSKRKYCSIRGSMIAVSGHKCIDGHECGLHGEDYYWCYTDYNKKAERCCSPWGGLRYDPNKYKYWWYTSYRNYAEEYRYTEY